MIPNRMMFFWGGGPLSWMRYMTFWSFSKLHPDWDMVLFVAPACTNPITWRGPQLVDSQQAVADDYFHLLPAAGVKVEAWLPPSNFVDAGAPQMADLCRWGALSKYGGWFADTDFLFVDSMETLKGYAGQPVALPVCRDWLATGMIGAAKDNRFTSSLYLAAKAGPGFGSFRAAGADTLARVLGLPDPNYVEQSDVQRRVRAAFPGTDFWFPNPAAFYTWGWYDSSRIFGQDEPALAETVAIHWNGSSRAAQRANRLYRLSTFREDQNTFTHFAQNLIDDTDQ
jgi:hypothetical protein